MSDFRMPSQLQTEYTAVRWIGGGSNGEVWGIRNLKSGRASALKVVPWVSEREKEKIAEEVAILSECSHKHVVAFEGSYPSPSTGQFFVQMEYCSTDLSHIIAGLKGKSQLLPETKISLYLTEILRALKFLHDPSTTGGSILHADLKAANIFITKAGRVKVGDFGCSLRIGNDTLTGGASGTMEYQAPEVLQRRDFGLPSDMFAVGVILFELCTTRLPFSPEETDGDLTKVANPKSDMPFTLSKSIKDLTYSLIAFDPATCPTAASILDDEAGPCGLAGREIDARDLMAAAQALHRSATALHKSATALHASAEERHKALDGREQALEARESGASAENKAPPKRSRSSSPIEGHSEKKARVEDTPSGIVKMALAVKGKLLGQKED